MPPQEWTPVALLAQLHVYYRQENDWPTVQQLAVFTELPMDRLKALLDVLLDRRLVKLDGETVYPWEAGPSPVVTYRLSPEEIAARYGPPRRYGSRAEARRAAASEVLGYWSTERPDQTMEEVDVMPKGQPIQWPPDEELVAMANEIRNRGGNVVDELTQRLGCSAFALRRRLSAARRALLREAVREAEATRREPAADPPEVVKSEGFAEGLTAAEAHEEADETMAHVDWPDHQTLLRMADELTAEGRSAAAVIAARLGVHPGTVRKRLHEARQMLAATQARDQAGPSSGATAGEPEPGEAPSSGEQMQMAEEEASRIIEATVAAPEPRSVDEGTATLPGEETPASGSQDAPVAGDLSTFRRMLLVDPERVTAVRELDHVTRAPEKVGDHWAQPVWKKGYLRWREWVCVAVLADGTCLMVPPAAARGAEENVERRTA